jgi:hypothetical protein
MVRVNHGHISIIACPSDSTNDLTTQEHPSRCFVAHFVLALRIAGQFAGHWVYNLGKRVTPLAYMPL